MVVKKHNSIYETLALIFVSVLIISNITSVKIADVGGFLFDAGTVLFPISYIVGDIITEIYGFRRLRGLVLKTGGMLVGVSLTLWLVGLLPAASAEVQASYDNILGVVWRIVLASILAFVAGEIVNGYVLAKLKIRDRGKHLWRRLIGSSAVGNAVDTSIFSVVAFAGTVSNSDLLNVIATVYLMKLAIEILVSPITMKLINRIKRLERQNVYEEPQVW